MKVRGWLLAGAFALAGCCRSDLMIHTLSFVLSEDADRAFVEAPVQIQTCIDDRCWFDALDAADAGWSGSPTYVRESRLLVEMYGATATGTKADVTLTALRDGGVVFAHSWKDVEFVDPDKNGPWCGPAEYLLANGPLTF